MTKPESLSSKDKYPRVWISEEELEECRNGGAPAQASINFQIHDDVQYLSFAEAKSIWDGKDAEIERCHKLIEEHQALLAEERARCFEEAYRLISTKDASASGLLVRAQRAREEAKATRGGV